MNGDDKMIPWCTFVDINEDSGSNVQTITSEIWKYLNIHGIFAPQTNVLLADGSVVEALAPVVGRAANYG
ncbi:hypothetical protein OCU04_000935 [Sclerotinia nivalis]|uniref:Uncharacterized protein n=1 Tax=Sclerotinia nivalis TaxID=352851 RepID=A0A9X0DNX0_9HELO|nr:hypothetical protein OCU04_000935 [Sclerotinia nivalis]